MLDYEEDADNNHIRMQPFGQFCQNALSCNAKAALLQSVICIHNCTLPSHYYSNLVPSLSDQGLSGLSRTLQCFNINIPSLFIHF